MFGLSLDTIEKIRGVFALHPQITQVLVYGSRAKGTYREGSDIDFALVGEDLKHDLLRQIKREIDELNTPYLFDIAALHNLESKDLLAHIERVGKVFYQKASVTANI